MKITLCDLCQKRIKSPTYLFVSEIPGSGRISLELCGECGLEVFSYVKKIKNGKKDNKE